MHAMQKFKFPLQRSFLTWLNHPPHFMFVGVDVPCAYLCGCTCMCVPGISKDQRLISDVFHNTLHIASCDRVSHRQAGQDLQGSTHL